MGIKLKNKYIYITVVVIGSYMLALSLIAGFDFVRNREYLKSDYYFKSTSFTRILYNYYNAEVRLQGEFKNYSQKSEEDKVNAKELQDIKNRYYMYMNNELLNIEIEHNNKLYYEQDKEVVKKLTEEKNKKIDEVKSKYNSINDEAFKKLIIEQKEKEYSTNKEFVEKMEDLKFYFKEKKTGKTYTNLSVINSENYLEKPALHTIKFPLGDNNKYYKYNSLDEVNHYLEKRGLEGYVIIPYDGDKNGRIYKDYRYFDSVRTRIIKEGAIFVFSFVSGLFILIYVKTETDVKLLFREKMMKVYNSTPLILRGIIFVSSIFIALFYGTKIRFFYRPLNISHFQKLTVIAIFVFCFILNIKGILRLIKNKDELKKQWHNSLLYKFPSVIKGSLLYKNTIGKIIIIFIATVLVGISIAVQFTNCWNKELYLVYVLFYLVFVGFYVLKKVTYFNKIVKATEEIAVGNLNYEIIKEGNGSLSKLTFNINNMKAGYKKSLEEQIKSERLKSELITNVSHDLKTPLTAIISYINLLKKQDLSKEEMEGYIGVLDKKSQRLKIIIEDLFEASKMASGAVELNIEKVDVAALLKQAMGEFDEKIKKSDLIFKVNIPKGNVYANLDGKKTWRVFENLIGNILKYSQTNTRVYIDLVEEDNKIKIIMKNIASYEMDFNVDEIFERFKRGDKSRNTEGSGLGLAIAKSIMELQGGSLGIGIDGDLFKAIVEINTII